MNLMTLLTHMNNHVFVRCVDCPVRVSSSTPADTVLDGAPVCLPHAKERIAMPHVNPTIRAVVEAWKAEDSQFAISPGRLAEIAIQAARSDIIREYEATRITMDGSTNNHLPVVAPLGESDTWGVYCLACSNLADDYVNPCAVRKYRWPTPKLRAAEGDG